ncbi:GtrA family protein [Riemerella columbina]|uniref:GtrA family protein n=1 Tax=Riemerella columbina TaxID=103810 RepID=UPI00266E99D6|nr:GtrA family protein [Riemerella columbina]WKS94893.1 GtrA family protein [Riemerella columbina]
MKLLKRHRQIILFIIAGGLSAVVEIGTFKLLSVVLPQYLPQEQDWGGVHYPLSNILSTTMGILSNYFLSIWFVFKRGKHSKRREFAYFMAVSFLSTALSLLAFQMFYWWVFTSNIEVPFFTFSRAILSKIAAIVLVSILNYSVKKRVIFNG